MKAKRFFNFFFWGLIIYALILRTPSVLTHFEFQNQKAPQFIVRTIKNEEIALHSQTHPMIVIFWATWCGPCEIELKRINSMIMQRKILPSDVLAISSREDRNTVVAAIDKRHYLFNVALDSNGSIAELYKVSATPTIVFIDKDQSINWMTAGVSPTLEFRISSFLK